LKIFLLATMAGLRATGSTNCPDHLMGNEGNCAHRNNGTFRPKTDESGGDVPIDKELAALFRGWHAKATGVCDRGGR
jgi:hypothetical protein